jgi:hypothetical protein
MASSTGYDFLRPKPKKPSSSGSSGSQDPGAATDTGYQPPYMSYDPAYDAQIRAGERGYADAQVDYGVQKTIDKQDYHQSLKDIHQSFKRGRTDIKTQRTRGLLDFGNKRTDISKTATRGEQDFGLRLGALFRNYGIKATNQTQQANAQGVADAGTLASAADARAANFTTDKGALDLAHSRQSEDIATALKRLGTDQSQFLFDTHQSKHRLKQDTKHDTKLTGLDYSRERQAQRLALMRAGREAAINTSDLTQQEIFQAMNLHPGAFDKYGNPKPGSPYANGSPNPPKTGGNKGGNKGGGKKKGGHKRPPNRGFHRG